MRSILQDSVAFVSRSVKWTVLTGKAQATCCSFTTLRRVRSATNGHTPPQICLFFFSGEFLQVLVDDGTALASTRRRAIRKWRRETRVFHREPRRRQDHPNIWYHSGGHEGIVSTWVPRIRKAAYRLVRQPGSFLCPRSLFVTHVRQYCECNFGE